MCGRYIQLIKSKNIKRKFDIKSVFADDYISYNISPNQNSLIITNKVNLNLESAEWGFKFNDSKTNLITNVINSRVETIKKKYLFKDSYLKRKCLIPANGYYEWSMKENSKIPYFINLPNCEAIYFAGIWKYINHNKNLKKVFSIITKDSNKDLKKIHHRMPIILSQTEGENYINDHKSTLFDNKFSSSIEANIEFYPISKFVNNPLNNSIECVKPLI